MSAVALHDLFGGLKTLPTLRQRAKLLWDRRTVLGRATWKEILSDNGLEVMLAFATESLDGISRDTRVSKCFRSLIDGMAANLLPFPFQTNYVARSTFLIFDKIPLILEDLATHRPSLRLLHAKAAALMTRAFEISKWENTGSLPHAIDVRTMQLLRGCGQLFQDDYALYVTVPAPHSSTIDRACGSFFQDRCTCA